jgi:hypothetical protein
MDIAAQAEVILRDAGYDTWQWPAATAAVTCFENSAIIGFLHVFASTDELLSRWEASQQAVLSRYSTALRAAGAKTWNVYSVFLAEGREPAPHRAVERIEENFALTRKIARTGIRLQDDVERALLPLTSVKARPILSASDFHQRLIDRLKVVPPDVLTAFLDTRSADEVARLLAEVS